MIAYTLLKKNCEVQHASNAGKKLLNFPMIDIVLNVYIGVIKGTKILSKIKRM